MAGAMLESSVVLSVLAISVALAMDATAAAASLGFQARRVRLGDVLLTSALFGGFQAAMPLVGWLLGAAVGPWVSAFDHWIAFGLLTLLGVNMLRAAWAPGEEPEPSDPCPFQPRKLLALAVATSIDALCAGITLPMLGAPLWFSVAVIGLATAVLSAAGIQLGRAAGTLVGARLTVFGGVVLVMIGLKILVEHLVAA